ncbi:hypothetical protein [Altererythrobacter sp. Root672]|uniref:hypothetical protein n=1 Tax=Altererythrobacter sp. Root672 TaxID=1736584 RepID=UPI0012E3D440|nr:hypothetical protein [Altererythrobacter sp. Root672]
MPSEVAWASRALAVGDAEQAASRSKAADLFEKQERDQTPCLSQLIWLRAGVNGHVGSFSKDRLGAAIAAKSRQSDLRPFTPFK